MNVLEWLLGRYRQLEGFWTPLGKAISLVAIGYAAFYGLALAMRGRRLLSATLFSGRWSVPLSMLTWLDLAWRAWQPSKPWKLRVPLSTVRRRVEFEILRPRPDDPERFVEWREGLNACLAGEPIRLGTCFDLQQAHDALEVYFSTLGLYRKWSDLGDIGRTAAVVCVDQGFLAPLHLLGGLLAHFDEQWPVVVEAYGYFVPQRESRKMLDRLSKLQLFSLDCWLLWGPSISLCTCEQWSGHVCMQLGYGDETNSIPIFSNTSLARNVLESCLGAKAGQSANGVARQVSVEGKLLWGPNAHFERLLSPAQVGLAKTPPGTVLFEAKECQSNTENVRRRYYSGYLWMMFVLGTATGELLWPDTRWRNLLPIFVHANLAEFQTLQFGRAQLAHQVRASLPLILSSLYPSEYETAAAFDRREVDSIRVVYACAIDDSACGSELMVSWPELAPGVGTSLDELKALRDSSMNFPKQVVLPGDMEYDRLSSGLSIEQFVSCHLGEVVAEYFEDTRCIPTSPAQSETSESRRSPRSRPSRGGPSRSVRAPGPVSARALDADDRA